MIDKKAYTQVFKLIEDMPQEMQEKIPQKLKEAIKNNMDLNYKCEIENLEEDLLEDTKKILSVLYTDYFSTDEERKVILAKEKSFKNSKK